MNTYYIYLKEESTEIGLVHHIVTSTDKYLPSEGFHLVDTKTAKTPAQAYNKSKLYRRELSGWRVN
jgi:hypothetical protein